MKGQCFSVSFGKSWIILLPLLTWNFARIIIPGRFPDINSRISWRLGILASAGVILTLLFHEMGHYACGVMACQPRRRISLFIFGGVEEGFLTSQSIRSPLVYLAGPVSSLLTALVWYLLERLSIKYDLAGSYQLILSSLWRYSLQLAGLNLLPAAPLDGGSFLRSTAYSKNPQSPLIRFIDSFTFSSSIALVLCGIAMVLKGWFIYGEWLLITGFFLTAAMRTADSRIRHRQFLRGEKTGRYMTQNPVCVPGGLTVKRFIDEYLYRYSFDVFPVSLPASPVKFITSSSACEIDSEKAEEMKIADLAVLCTEENSVTTETDVMDTLELMRKLSRKSIVVTNEQGYLEGVVSYKDLLRFLSLKIHLNEYDTDSHVPVSNPNSLDSISRRSDLSERASSAHAMSNQLE